MTASQKLQYNVAARRIDANGSIASCKSAQIELDTSIAGRRDAFNPAELFLASIAACIIKGVERVAPMIDFEFSDIEISVQGTRQDSPPKIIMISYEIVVGTDESDQRLELLHKNIRKYGTISNTVASAVQLEGKVRRSSVPRSS